MKDLVKKDVFKKQEFYDFIRKAFKEGTIPLNKAEFERCFSIETTDGYPCFVYKFGKEEDDVVMLFFYETFCVVPQRYVKNLKNDELCNINLLNLDYQKLLAKYSNDSIYLEILQAEVQIRYNINMSILQSLAQRDFCKEGYNEEYGKFKNQEEVKKSINNFSKKFNEVNSFIEEKLKHQNKEYDFSETKKTKTAQKELNKI